MVSFSLVALLLILAGTPPRLVSGLVLSNASASSASPAELPKLRGRVSAQVPVAVPFLNATVKTTGPNWQTKGCFVGDNVYAPYSGDGKYYGAVIQKIDQNGLITLRWYNDEPRHRYVWPRQLLPPCTPGAPSTLAETYAPPPPVPTLSETQAKGVVHFLFMVNDYVPHLDMWQKFFAGVPAGSWRVKVHCQDYEACKLSGLLDVQGFEMVETTPTWYCHDLVTAMARLLESALETPAVEGASEKYVFLSESTLPVRPFAEIQAYLLADDDSDFCLFPRDQWAYTTIDSHSVLMPKHHQWVVLNRQHAKMFVREWVPVNANGVWRVWLRGGSWTGKERFVSPQHFNRPAASNSCADEWAFVATIFGAVEPEEGARTFPGFGGGQFYTSGPLAYTTQGRCRTFTFWETEDGPAFSHLASAVNDDLESSMSCYPRCLRRPATFSKMGVTGLTAMRHSHFLFARKFSAWAGMPHYEEIVIR